MDTPVGGVMDEADKLNNALEIIACVNILYDGAINETII